MTLPIPSASKPSCEVNDADILCCNTCFNEAGGEQQTGKPSTEDDGPDFLAILQSRRLSVEGVVVDEGVFNKPCEFVDILEFHVLYEAISALSSLPLLCIFPIQCLDINVFLWLTIRAWRHWLVRIGNHLAALAIGKPVLTQQQRGFSVLSRQGSGWLVIFGGPM